MLWWFLHSSSLLVFIRLSKTIECLFISLESDQLDTNLMPTIAANIFHLVTDGTRIVFRISLRLRSLILSKTICFHYQLLYVKKKIYQLELDNPFVDCNKKRP